MQIKAVKIGKKIIGFGKQSYIIAEIGSNFDGKLSQAKKLIKLAKKSGADAAKFQTFSAKSIISKNGFSHKSTFQSKWKKSVWETYEDAELPLLWHEKLSDYAKKIGIDFLSTPYNFDAVDLLMKLEIPAIKIGSGEINNLEFLKYVAKTKKPILLATGASTMDEISRAVKIIYSSGNKKLILMQSVTQYPSPISEANLNVLTTFKNKFHLNIGYSDHSPGDLVILASIALGACVIEKHFTSNSSLEGPDHPHSMTPRQFSNMVSSIRILESALGDGIKKIEPSEKQTRILQRRGIWTRTIISKGEKFTEKNIVKLRPSVKLDASQYSFILNKHAKRNLDVDFPISLTDIN